MTFGEALKDLIEEHGLTQKQLALNLGISPSTLGGYIQGTREPDFQTLKALAQYFRVTTDYLLDCPSERIGSPSEYEVLRIFRMLSEEQRAIYLEQGKAFVRFNAAKTK